MEEIESGRWQKALRSRVQQPGEKRTVHLTYLHLHPQHMSGVLVWCDGIFSRHLSTWNEIWFDCYRFCCFVHALGPDISSDSDVHRPRLDVSP